MRPRRALPALLLLLLPALARAEPPNAAAGFADRLPRAWCGVFRWEGDAREQHVTIRFARWATRPDGALEAEGPGLVRYEDEAPRRAVPFRMRAVIDRATRRIEMFESIEFFTPAEAGNRFGMTASATGALVLWTRGRGPHVSESRNKR